MALNNPYALFFDGVDDYVRFSSQVIPLGAFSIMFVFAKNVYDDPTTTEEIVSTSYARASDTGIRLYFGELGLYFVGTAEIADWNFRIIYENMELLLDGDPHIVMACWDGTTSAGGVQLYVDDLTMPVGSDTASKPNSVAHSYNLYVGRQANTAQGRFYEGTLDNLAIWDKVLSAAERRVYKDRWLAGNEPGLSGLYRFDYGSGNTAIDSSPNANHGAIYGATWVPGLVDLHLPGEVPISAALCGSSSLSTRSDRIRGLSAHLAGAATATGGEPIRIRGLSANLAGTGTVNAKMNLIAALKAHLQGKATLKSNILVLFIPDGVYVIDADEIFAKDQPSRGQVVANYIEVWVNPLKPTEEPEEVYRSKDPVTIPAGTTKTITIHFDDEPVTEPAVALEEAGANLSIVDTKYYAWGADVKIRNTGSGAQTCLVVATGKPLKVQGREMVVRKDEVSIQENGLKKYTFDNPFVQDRATAELIADKLLSFSNAKRDIKIDWRGDPALELADVTMIPEYQRRDIDQRGIFYVTKQELEFDGGLRAKLEGRKM